MSSQSPGGVPDPTRIGPTRAIEGEGDRVGSMAGQSFQSMMEGGPAQAGKGVPAPSLSPFDLAHGQTTLPASPNFNTVLAQAKTAQATLGGIQAQLNTPQLKLKRSQKYVLNNKFTEANDVLRSANAKMGADSPPAQELPAGSSPVDKFLGYVSDGQGQLDAAVRQLAELKDKGTTMSPGDFLQIQLKLNKAQQILQFSSIVLSNAIDAMKQIMSIQL